MLGLFTGAVVRDRWRVADPEPEVRGGRRVRGRWRTILRIHHALVHLTGGRSVTDTAIACGWSNPSSFIEAFTAVAGQTPGRYQADLHGHGA